MMWISLNVSHPWVALAQILSVPRGQGLGVPGRPQAVPVHPRLCSAPQTAPKVGFAGQPVLWKLLEAILPPALPAVHGLFKGTAVLPGNGKSQRIPEAAPLPALAPPAPFVTKPQTMVSFARLAPKQLVPSSPPSHKNRNVFYSYGQDRIELVSNPARLSSGTAARSC